MFSGKRNGKKMMNLKEKLVTMCVIALGALVLTSGSMPAAAQMPGPHPEYLRAIADLNAARAVLKGGGWVVPAHAQAASEVIDEIDHTVNDLKYVAKVDGTNPNAAFPPDASGSPEGRLHSALAYLDKAHNDVSGPESDPVALKGRDGALSRIDRSRNVLKHALTGH
jgi:hypothetical protein